jgi:CRP-like cAMP-binding protein
MTEFDQFTVRNRILAQLPREAFEELRGEMVAMDLPLRHEVTEPNVSTPYVCFIESGLASVVAKTRDEKAIEVGHVGCEGLSGTHLALRVERTPNRTFMQVAGEGIIVPVSTFTTMLRNIPQANDLMLKYVYYTELQLAHSALANARYKMHERLARWLLMCHDRLATDDLPLTHEFLSLMLGVRRSGVTNELHVIEGMRMIKATRGNIRILDRAGLEDIAGGSYGTPEGEYERLIGPWLRPLRK